uniref:Uncharacterized protein n=1 Tax=Candidatus Kentrum sp. LFY TaxID=2126342 RepID=A0A450V791_9GAMM|nr:MAG: hypothetical protein BECKLFY1418B_GA0070995_12002 [Candidatus Kentron sp. LFY]
MNDTRIKTLEQVRGFLAGTSGVELSISSKEECYRWIEQILIRLGYRNCGKAEKGLLLDSIEKVSGYSRIQVKRLVKQYIETGCIERRHKASKGFTRNIPEQMFVFWRTRMRFTEAFQVRQSRRYVNALGIFNQAEYERLASISVGHMYNSQT